MSHSEFDECMNSTRLLMKSIGTWPDNNLEPKWYSRYYYLLVPAFFMIFFIVIPQTTMLVFVWGNLNQVLEILSTVDVIIALAFLKSLKLWYNKAARLILSWTIADFKKLLLEMKEDWNNVDQNKRKVMWKNAKLGKSIMRVVIIINFGSVVSYSIIALILLNAHLSREHEIVNTTNPRPMFLASKFFFETKNSPTFEIVWTCQLFAALFGCSAYSSADGFFIFCILHLCSNLKILQLDLKNFTLNLRNQKFSVLEKSIINRHIHLQRFNYCIEEHFNKIFLIQMIGYSLCICLQADKLVGILTEKNSSSFDLIFSIIFTIANFGSPFLYCFVAEKLRTESSNIFFSVYEMNWYELRPTECKMLLFIMQSTQTPFHITTGKFASLSLQYFIKIVKTALGYLSMLLAVKSR